MNPEPHVVCVMLTADRQAYTERAIRCFLSQTYENRELFILDTGAKPFELPAWPFNERDLPKVRYVYKRRDPSDTVGSLRNLAGFMVRDHVAEADDDVAIVHWDSDDWSAPERLDYQIYNLVHSGAEASGFHNLLFWNKPKAEVWEYDWRRRDRVLGTSLCYWYATWRRVKFPLMPSGEDTTWMNENRIVIAGFNSLYRSNGVQLMSGNIRGVGSAIEKPMLVAEVHGGNTSGVYQVFDKHQPAYQPEWRRATEWDEKMPEILGYSNVKGGSSS